MLYISYMNTHSDLAFKFDYMIPVGENAYVCTDSSACRASSIKVTDDELPTNHIEHVFKTKRPYYYNESEIVHDMDDYLILQLPEESFAVLQDCPLFLVISAHKKQKLRRSRA